MIRSSSCRPVNHCTVNVIRGPYDLPGRQTRGVLSKEKTILKQKGRVSRGRSWLVLEYVCNTGYVVLQTGPLTTVSFSTHPHPDTATLGDQYSV